jgi:phospholipase C
VYPRSPIKHIIVLMLQNRSFDNLFGTFPGANGIAPGVSGYSQVDGNGQTITPTLLTDLTTADVNHTRTTYVAAWDNGKMDKYAATNGDLSMGHYDGSTPGVSLLWNWARQYSLADNYFASVMGSAPANELYMVAAADNGTPAILLPAYGPCNGTTHLAPPYTFPNVGDQLSNKKFTWKWFHEHYGDCPNYVPQENPFQFFTSTHDTGIADLGGFFQHLNDGTLPEVSFICPAPWHTLHPGSGSVQTASEWVDYLLNQIKNSSSWPSTAVIVTFDESGGWWDHVPPPQVDGQGLGARVPLLVISPFAKTGYISHTQLDHVSILRFIQWNWGLQPLNDRNGQSADLRDMFVF